MSEGRNMTLSLQYPCYSLSGALSKIMNIYPENVKLLLIQQLQSSR